jgi:DNA-binding NarL/FixJ family response regulator
MVRILIADDHEVVRKGVRALLETRPDFTVIAEACDGREAYQKILELRPDVTIMDISMPEMNGIETMRRVARAGVPTEVLALTMHSSETLARELLEAGARGYVLKSDAARDLVSAVESLGQHRSFLSAATSNIVVDEFRRGTGAQNDRQKLSAREVETLQLLTEGKTNKDIAKLLVLSVRTVETHRANIMAKLNLHSIGELVHYAIRNNIVRL